MHFEHCEKQVNNILDKITILIHQDFDLLKKIMEEMLNVLVTQKNVNTFDKELFHLSLSVFIRESLSKLMKKLLNSKHKEDMLKELEFFLEGFNKEGFSIDDLFEKENKLIPY